MKKNRKTLALIIMLAIVLSMLPMAASAATYGHVTVDIPSGENLSLSTPTQSGTTYTYSVVSSIPGYNPANFSLHVEPDSGYTVTVVGQSGATVTQNGTNPGGNYWLVTPSTSGASSVKITASNGEKHIVNCSVPSGGTPAGSGVYAYLPAPGQFTNEGCNTGGWGDAYVSGSGGLKSMVGNIATTGVSLGYFGGYFVLDMGEDVSNSDSNMYGIDLITYGNAFIGNSEPGCLQVAQAVNGAPGDANSDGVIWYDIAGSLYYDSDTVAGASLTYTNPHPTDDSSESWPQSGTVTTPNSSNDVPYTIDPSTTTHYVVYNAFHKHAYFPLWANYFVARTTGTGNDTVTLGPLDKANVTDPIGNHSWTGFPFATYTRNTSTGSTLTLTGVMLGDATVITTGTYRFGYADVHPKYTTDTTHFAKAYNPYAFTDTNITNGTSWNNYLKTANNGAAAGGGDPIDISWAVYPAKYDHTVGSYTAGTANPNVGLPAELSNIRFIRVYTGAASMNPTSAFGEISTELCGVYKANGSGSGEPTIDTNYIYIDGNTTIGYVSSGGVQVPAGTYTVYSNATYIYKNGTNFTSGNTVTVSSGHPVQLISQTGTESPIVVVLYV